MDGVDGMDSVKGVDGMGGAECSQKMLHLPHRRLSLGLDGQGLGKGLCLRFA